jgi:hypothetical protein
MLTNDVTALKENNFSITKNLNMQTVVEHTQPFFIKGTAGDIAAPFNTDTKKYTVTLSGHPVRDQLSESIVQHSMPLIASMNSFVEPEDEQEESPTSKLATKLFSELENDSIFYRSNDANAAQYRKIDTTTFKRVGESIGSSLELYATANQEVFITEMDFSLLTPDQKTNIVQHTPSGMDEAEFSDHVVNEIDNIAGLETLSDDELSDLVDELYSMYQQ